VSPDRTAELAKLWIHLIGHRTYRGYVIAHVDGKTSSITCLTCGLTSFNPTDLAEKYCGACHVFHEDPVAPDAVCGAILTINHEQAVCTMPAGHLYAHHTREGQGGDLSWANDQRPAPDAVREDPQ
jgi:hypothetical protein